MDIDAIRQVESYLEALDSRLGQKLPKLAFVEEQLGTLETDLVEASGVKKLGLLQQREDLVQVRAEVMKADEAEAGFAASIADYAAFNGISYSTLREFGISKALLVRGGVRRTRRVAPVKD